jgi:hypothetical protein
MYSFRVIYYDRNVRFDSITDYTFIRLLSIYLSIYLSMALQHYVEPWPLFQFLNSIDTWYYSLDGASAHRKAATCTQDRTNRTDAHRHPCLKWDSTQDPTV